MRRLPFLAIAVLVIAVPALAGCSSEQHELDVSEGVPLHLGDLSYNIALSRFLNPHDAEDEGYLSGQPIPPPSQQYFGVFMTVTNDSSEDKQIGQMKIVDTRGNEFQPIPSTSQYALPQDAMVPADDQFPQPNTTAEYGPIKGSLVLFELDNFVSENRPIELEIAGENGEVGRVQLDL